MNLGLWNGRANGGRSESSLPFALVSEQWDLQRAGTRHELRRMSGRSIGSLDGFPIQSLLRVWSMIELQEVAGNGLRGNPLF